MHIRPCFLVLLGVVGCYSNSNLRADLQRRASFDLSCQEPLQMVPLGTFPNEITNSYGVSGCGRKATYLLLNTGVWAMNSSSGEGEPRAASPSSSK
jgi:hypothetical protein